MQTLEAAVTTLIQYADQIDYCIAVAEPGAQLFWIEQIGWDQFNRSIEPNGSIWFRVAGGYSALYPHRGQSGCQVAADKTGSSKNAYSVTLH